ncbi:DNA-directed RNA polymerase III subunit RPC6 [Aphanomyces cochlioides]|nr:DNA-directed RNA polymerase III subunit RPC6 [Aphanomyces cochlioides]
MDHTNVFLDLLASSSDAISDAKVRETFRDEYAKLPPVINNLMREGRIRIFKQGANSLMYGLVAKEEAERMRGLTAEQIAVLREIEGSGNKGIWTRDIKTKTNIPEVIIRKTIKILETRQLIKAVKSIAQKNRKLYMKFDLDPSRDITGGPWYNEQEFDHGFIDALRDFVCGFIKAKGVVTLKQITDQVHESGITRVSLGPDEMMSILNTLIYEERVEEVRAIRIAHGEVGEVKYKVSKDVSDFDSLSETPCGICPVFDQCADGNIISPATCVYLTKWLDIKDEF